MAGQLSGIFLWLFKVSCVQPNLVIEMHLNPALPLVMPQTRNRGTSLLLPSLVRTPVIKFSLSAVCSPPHPLPNS